MGSIMIKCPVTGAAIATGLTAEPATFARSPVFFSRTLCPYCRQTHEWFAAEAWVEETQPQESRVAA
ncbi:MAG TPA: hypothetical protein VFQ27_13055 [Xanthobacteraceae bacterium]|nr:hypothetical protein [Xanthobacteraceae bacterium]